MCINADLLFIWALLHIYHYLYIFTDLLSKFHSYTLPNVRGIELYKSQNSKVNMNVKDWLDKTKRMALETLLQREAVSHAEKYVSEMTAETKTSYKETKTFDIKPFQRSQFKWFNEHFRVNIYDRLFPSGPPRSFEPENRLRSTIFYDGLSTSARRMFMIQSLKEMWRQLDKCVSACPTGEPKPSLYF